MKTRLRFLYLFETRSSRVIHLLIVSGIVFTQIMDYDDSCWKNLYKGVMILNPLVL